LVKLRGLGPRDPGNYGNLSKFWEFKSWQPHFKTFLNSKTTKNNIKLLLEASIQNFSLAFTKSVNMGKGQGTTGRFGTRYGRTPKTKLKKIESKQKASYNCPFCNYKKIKRVSSGIWACNKCNIKIAGKAYEL
jgi:large subunit ribosomal protein L37Ae